MPFDDSTTKGFMVSLVLQSFGGYTFMLVMMSIILFYMGYYMYLMAFLDDFQTMFDRIDRIKEANGEERRCQMTAIIQFHEKFSAWVSAYNNNSSTFAK